MQEHDLNSPNPQWWNDKQTTAWERVKAAIRRDWEQTKSDFTKHSSGHDLNQDLTDTVRQAAGKQPIPAGNIPNPPDEADIKRHEQHAQRTREQAQTATERANNAVIEGSGSASKLQQKALEANIQARQAESEERYNKSRRWEDVEAPTRYGFGAAIHYSDEWNDQLERTMQNEWGQFNRQTKWEDARDSIRLGWDRARRQDNLS